MWTRLPPKSNGFFRSPCASFLLSSFCIVLLTNKLTNADEYITSLAEVISTGRTRVVVIVWVVWGCGIWHPYESFTPGLYLDCLGTSENWRTVWWLSVSQLLETQMHEQMPPTPNQRNGCYLLWGRALIILGSSGGLVKLLDSPSKLGGSPTGIYLYVSQWWHTAKVSPVPQQHKDWFQILVQPYI